MNKKSTIPVIQSPKGMHDILPQDQVLWDKIRKILCEITGFYNFSRIETPIVERAEVFERSAGETSEMVKKQMFRIARAGKEKYVLRPEATAPISRAYIEHGLHHLGQPLKLFTEGPFFRYEQPQAGRFRQFHQINFEILSNENDPLYDAQIVLISYRLLQELKVKDVDIAINTIGCKECRAQFRKNLKHYFDEYSEELCKDCKNRLLVNPLRILDCKEEKEIELKKDAPVIIDHVCKKCHQHFKSVLEYLDELELPYVLDHYLVRGLDYYSKTVFEFVTEEYKSSLGGGGRYDYLVEMLGGKSTPAVGAALGVERMIEVMRLKEATVSFKPKKKIFLVHIGDLAKKKSLSIIEQLRKERIGVHEVLGKDSFKAQLKYAEKKGATFTLIFGQKEAFEGTVIIRNIKTGAQETVPLTKIENIIKRKLT